MRLPGIAFLGRPLLSCCRKRPKAWFSYKGAVSLCIHVLSSATLPGTRRCVDKEYDPELAVTDVAFEKTRQED